ncbi:hypothetical protein [Streptomyces viridochromogenes]|uniref:hypothetical protein n=1 Tax=Streptomyces viridochromogenes TaxID=1938 RepID=UPI00099C6B27|nr:hypothetical protein [Streptomyces viridochromogenes]
MSKTEHETSPRRTLACPVCKRSVDMIIKGRHKTLGIFVPVWGPGPCHNPDCSACLAAPEHKIPQKH